MIVITPEMLDEARRYSMLIAWSDEDQAYSVTVPELPGCRTHGATHEGALLMGEEAIAGWLATAREAGEPIPAPRVFVSSAR